MKQTVLCLVTSHKSSVSSYSISPPVRRGEGANTPSPPPAIDETSSPKEKEEVDGQPGTLGQTSGSAVSPGGSIDQSSPGSSNVSHSSAKTDQTPTPSAVPKAAQKSPTEQGSPLSDSLPTKPKRKKRERSVANSNSMPSPSNGQSSPTVGDGTVLPAHDSSSNGVAGTVVEQNETASNGHPGRHSPPFLQASGDQNPNGSLSPTDAASQSQPKPKTPNSSKAPARRNPPQPPRPYRPPRPFPPPTKQGTSSSQRTHPHSPRTQDHPPAQQKMAEGKPSQADNQEARDSPTDVIGNKSGSEIEVLKEGQGEKEDGSAGNALHRPRTLFDETKAQNVVSCRALFHPVH